MSGPREVRTDLRQEDSHASWREVYVALDVDPDGHEGGDRR